MTDQALPKMTDRQRAIGYVCHRIGLTFSRNKVAEIFDGAPEEIQAVANTADDAAEEGNVCKCQRLISDIRKYWELNYQEGA